jgi:hypothetical protein
MNNPYTSLCGQRAKTPKYWLVTDVAGCIGSKSALMDSARRLAEQFSPFARGERQKAICREPGTGLVQQPVQIVARAAIMI